MDTKETLKPDLTIIGNAGLFVRVDDSQPTIYVCPTLRRLKRRAGRQRKSPTITLSGLDTEVIHIGRRRSKVINSWSQHDDWKTVFQNYFTHNAEPNSCVCEALHFPAEFTAITLDEHVFHKDVRVIDIASEALDEIPIMRQSSASVFHAPLHHYRSAGSIDENERSATVSSDLILSLVAHIAHMDVERKLQDRPPLPTTPVGSTTWTGRRPAVEQCTETMGEWLPDKSLKITNIRRGSTIVDLVATNRDACILQSILESGIHEYLLEDEAHRIEGKSMPLLKKFHIRGDLSMLPLAYADFADTILNLNERHESEVQDDAYRNIERYWTTHEVLGSTARRIAESSRLHFALRKCG
jgi:hypothetical protein